MTNRREKRTRTTSKLKTVQTVESGRRPAPTLSRRKLWLFRLAALVGAPLLFAGLLELCLRLAGYGYPTAFLLSGSRHERDVLEQNNQFAWRFLGPHMGRLPESISISAQKPPNTVRIFVFGESAAQGDPQPAYGPARMIQALLGQRYPGVRFEVVNAAMTAINSHAVLRIARDCTRANADIWVIYMGNNEVVGPFGAGTVFGQQTPPLPLIRATLALKSTRSGQLLDSLLTSPLKNSSGQGEWRGMEMFLDQQVQADDPRMKAVYQNFQQNLADIIRAGQRSGAGIVVSTMAVNLRDCAPFASAHRAGLAESDVAQWERLYQLGSNAQREGKLEEAAQHYQAAAQMDNHFAELRFRQALCAAAMGQFEIAQEHFRAARDLDTLRFRCDSELNSRIRQTVSNHLADGVLLADVEATFEQYGKEGFDSELFYEHVHPTFKGNYMLARTIAEQVEKLLPTAVVAPTAETQPWPSEADCAKRLGWADWARLAALEAILVRVSGPPFIGQMNHDLQVRSLRSTVQELATALQPTGIAEGRRICEAALAIAPDDPVLQGHLAALKLLGGDLEGAAAAERRELESFPTSAQAWSRLGMILSRQQKLEEACEAFRNAIKFDPGDVMHRQNLAQGLWQLGRRDEAISQLRKAVKFQSNFSLGWISLGQLLEESDRRTEAEECYQKALACRSFRTADLLANARLCRNRGWHEAALTNFNQAITLNPTDTRLRLETGQSLLALKRYSEATRLFGEVVQMAPDSAVAHQHYGSALGQQGKPVEAEQQFREALRLAPDLLEARLNLGIALLSQGRSVEALENLEEVLRRNPTNELALRYVQPLRSRPSPKPR